MRTTPLIRSNVKRRGKWFRQVCGVISTAMCSTSQAPCPGLLCSGLAKYFLDRSRCPCILHTTGVCRSICRICVVPSLSSPSGIALHSFRPYPVFFRNACLGLIGRWLVHAMHDAFAHGRCNPAAKLLFALTGDVSWVTIFGLPHVGSGWGATCFENSFGFTAMHRRRADISAMVFFVYRLYRLRSCPEISRIV